MSKKGGYVIVDLKGQSITAGTPFTLDGVTARLNRAKTKACLLSGFAIGAEEKRDVFVDLQKTEDGYVAEFGSYRILIEDDEITVTEKSGGLFQHVISLNSTSNFVVINERAVAYTTEDLNTYLRGINSSLNTTTQLSGTFILATVYGQSTGLKYREVNIDESTNQISSIRKIAGLVTNDTVTRLV